MKPDLREAVAKAIANVGNTTITDEWWSDLGQESRDYWLEYADAALLVVSLRVADTAAQRDVLLQSMWDARTALGFDPDGDAGFHSTDYEAIAKQHVREAEEVRSDLEDTSDILRVQHALEHRAKQTLDLARSAEGEHLAAAMRGKARGLREAIDLVKNL